MSDLNSDAHPSGLYSSVVERQSCKLKVLGSIPSGGCMHCTHTVARGQHQKRRIPTPEATAPDSMAKFALNVCKCLLATIARCLQGERPLQRKKGTPGFEPGTCGSAVRCSGQLSYVPLSNAASHSACILRRKSKKAVCRALRPFRWQTLR